MIELQSDNLVFRFPEVHPGAKLNVDFQRTLRIPDDGKEYPLPPGLGSFPMRHIDDFSRKVPDSWLKRGGVLLPMYQAEALWISLSCRYVERHGAEYPFAVKVATGKINAVTGESWRRGLSRNPQDYLVAPRQPWLDGYCVEKGLIRQFVAMPLGEAYSVEELLSGEAEFGGIQIEVLPMKREVFERRFPKVERQIAQPCPQLDVCFRMASPDMGLAPGGQMRQEIYDDPYNIHDWDTEHSSRCFIHLVNSTAWRHITGTNPPSQPPTASNYSAAGLPWFDYYDADAQALEGSTQLAGVKSVVEMGAQKDENPLPENASVTDPEIVSLRPGRQSPQVREGEF